MEENTQAKMLGRYIVVDPHICHGKPTFRGTRIMVWQALELAAMGMSWETITEQFHSSISKQAIAEAIQLANKAFETHVDEFVIELESA